MSIASTIAVSGMTAASLRLQVSANNVANALSSGPLPGAANSGGYPAAYAPERVNQTDVAGGGTSARIGFVSPSYVQAYDPAAPYADSHGMVASPNVDLATELVQQLVARYTFAANAHVVRTDAQMTSALFDALA
jgi:flagellar basal-body rod protein FlgC